MRRSVLLLAFAGAASGQYIAPGYQLQWACCTVCRMCTLFALQYLHFFFLAHLSTVFAQHSCRLPSCLLLSFAAQLSLTMDWRFSLCHSFLCSVDMAPSTTCYKITLRVPYTSTLAAHRMCWSSVCVLYACICCPFNKLPCWKPATFCEDPHKTDLICEIRAQMQFFGKKAEPPPPAGGQGGLEPRKGFTVVTWLPSGVQSYAKPGTQFVQMLDVHWPCVTFSQMRVLICRHCAHIRTFKYSHAQTHVSAAHPHANFRFALWNHEFSGDVPIFISCKWNTTVSDHNNATYLQANALATRRRLQDSMCPMDVGRVCAARAKPFWSSPMEWRMMCVFVHVFGRLCACILYIYCTYIRASMALY